VVGDEPISRLLDASAESRVPFNFILEHQGSASWLLVFRGARAERNALLRGVQPLGPFCPFNGTTASTVGELLEQSVRDRQLVLMVGDHGQEGTLVVAHSGDADKAGDLAKAIDRLTNGRAQQVHARLVNVKTDIEPGP
jgi:hypothetical protein